jgi:hypothetical protein
MTRIGTNNYDNPNFLVVQYATPIAENNAPGSASSNSEGTIANITGSTLRVCYKAEITGVSYQIASGPQSAVGTNSISVSRTLAGGNASIWYTETITTSLGASMANDVHEYSLASAMTISSLGDIAHLQNLCASAHKNVLIKNIVWRYRLLPQTIEFADSP